MKNADIHTLYNSELFSIKDYLCKEQCGSVSDIEIDNNYSISFFRKGSFEYKFNNNLHDCFNGIILFGNPNDEYIIKHNYHIPDQCTNIYVSKEILEEAAQTYFNIRQKKLFFNNISKPFKFPFTTVSSNPSFDYLHGLVYNLTSENPGKDKLKLDSLLVHLIDEFFAYFAQAKKGTAQLKIDRKLKDLHLETIERGKNFIIENFREDISLSAIASNAYVSPYHFSRIFRQFTNASPYNYLLEVRLKHAMLLLKNTSLYITEICYESGFNRLEHFIATFTRRFGISPLKFRKRLQ
ncbi:MAG: helix-turn-helix transcriptional regulator [Ignavibacteriales bacterium]|nr:helix-turn-helix transcriptional regulator [Ignavibacteriales bacterium]